MVSQGDLCLLGTLPLRGTLCKEHLWILGFGCQNSQLCCPGGAVGRHPAPSYFYVANPCRDLRVNGRGMKFEKNRRQIFSDLQSGRAWTESTSPQQCDSRFHPSCPSWLTRFWIFRGRPVFLSFVANQTHFSRFDPWVTPKFPLDGVKTKASSAVFLGLKTLNEVHQDRGHCIKN